MNRLNGFINEKKTYTNEISKFVNERRRLFFNDKIWKDVKELLKNIPLKFTNSVKYVIREMFNKGAQGSVP